MLTRDKRTAERRDREILSVAVGSLSAVRFSLTFGAAGPGRDPRGLAELARLAEDVG